MVSPSGENAAWERPGNRRINSPVATSHNFTGPSLEDVAKYLPLPEYLTKVTGLSSEMDRIKLARSTSQNWTPPDCFPPLPPNGPHSVMPAVRVLPSGENTNGESGLSVTHFRVTLPEDASRNWTSKPMTVASTSPLAVLATQPAPPTASDQRTFPVATSHWHSSFGSRSRGGTDSGSRSNAVIVVLVESQMR